MTFVPSTDIFMLLADHAGKQVTLLYDDETDQGFLTVTEEEHDLDLVHQTGNALELSAIIRNEVGYAVHAEMLIKAEIPLDHPLWQSTGTANASIH